MTADMIDESEDVGTDQSDWVAAAFPLLEEGTGNYK